MRINKFVAGGVLIFLLAVGGFFALHKDTYPPNSLFCGPGPCTVRVVVENGCIPRPERDPIVVMKKNGATNIFWEAPTGYTFTDPDGIMFKNNNGDLDPRPGRTNGGARWHVVDNPAHSFQIQYRIQIQTNGGPPCTGPDPVIWNE